MRTEQKLVRHGNATGVSLPKQMLMHLGWLAGERIVIELLEDDSIRLRERNMSDFARLPGRRRVYNELGRVTGKRPEHVDQLPIDLAPVAEPVSK